MTNGIWLVISLAAAFFATLPSVARAQSGRELIVAGGPVRAFTNDQAVLCATNFSPKPITATVEFKDAIADTLISSSVLTLGRIGSSSPPSGACEELVVPHDLILIGLVKVTGLPPGATGTLVGSLELIGARTVEPPNSRSVVLIPVSERCQSVR